MRFGEIDDHRGVKGNQPGPLVDGVEQGAHVAEARKDLGIPPDQSKIQERKEFQRAVPAPLGQDEFHSFIQKCGVDLFYLFSVGRQSGDKAPAENFESQFFEILDAVGEILLLFNQPAGQYGIDNFQICLPFPSLGGRWAIDR